MIKRFELSSALGTLTIWSPSQAQAESSATFDYLMGEGPLFFPVSVKQVPLLHQIEGGGARAASAVSSQEET